VGRNLPQLGQAASAAASKLPGVGDYFAAPSGDLSNREMARVQSIWSQPDIDKAINVHADSKLLQRIKSDQTLRESITPKGYSVAGKNGPSQVTPGQLRSLLDLQKEHAPTRTQRFFGAQSPEARKASGPVRKLLGGPAATLATMAPLLYREWLGNGYRSGRPAFEELLAAQRGRA
jgi:hypothetical protein